MDHCYIELWLYPYTGWIHLVTTVIDDQIVVGDNVIVPVDS